MITYKVYYLVGPNGIEAGPFSTVDAAVNGKKNFHPMFATLLTVVKGNIQVEPL